MCIFLAVAVVSVVYAASLTAVDTNSQSEGVNRVFEFLFTANESRTLLLLFKLTLVCFFS
jgi:hypothetical protein